MKWPGYEAITIYILYPETPSFIYNSRTEHGVKTKLTSIVFCRRGTVGLEAHGCELSVTKLSTVPHILVILANCECYLLY